jgi:hypothetical protein
MTEKLTSPKIREAKTTADLFTLITWIGCVTVFVTAMVGEWWWCVSAFVIAATAAVVAIRAGREVNDCQVIAQTLKEKQREDVNALYGEK